MEDNKKKKGSISNIKSKYILEQIMTILCEIRLLDIILYNKNIKDKLNKTVNDYRKLSLKSEIEIELVKILYKNFINIMNEQYDLFDIYNSDTKEKIPIDYRTEKPIKITIIINFGFKNISELFRESAFIKKKNFIRYYREDITDMSKMFQYCKSLEEINFSNFNTNNVLDMSFMFEGCEKLKKLIYLFLILKM